MKLTKQLSILLVILLAIVGCGNTVPTEEPTEGDEPTSLTLRYVSEMGAVRVGKEGVIKVGEDSVAPVTIDFFFDPVCEACAVYLDITGEEITKHIQDGLVELVFHPVSYLNDKTPDDYSNRAGAYFLAVAEFAPDKALDFVLSIVSADFRPDKPGADITNDSKFIQVLEDLELTYEQLDKVETNKENFVAPVIAATSDFLSADSSWIRLSEATDDNGVNFVYTPFILVNKSGELKEKALILTSADSVVKELNEAIKRVDKGDQGDSNEDESVDVETGT